MSKDVYVLGGFQTDFARHWSREQATVFDLLAAATEGALADCDLEASEIETIHVGNFTAELFANQGHLGALAAACDPQLDGTPSARHEAACASGSVAALAAMSEIEAERYGVALVVGVELMRNVEGERAADYLGAAAWRGREGQEARYLWPHMFSLLIEEYERRYGLDYNHLMSIARKNYANGRRNPKGQTRKWKFDDAAFTADDATNPVIEGKIRRQDCGQITDGSAAIVLAGPEFAERYAARRGLRLEALARIKGWGHRTATMLFADKMAQANRSPDEYLLPHLRQTILDAQKRAGLDIESIDAVEGHDCFSITEYMFTEHLGLAAPGEAWRAIEEGVTEFSGTTPINPSGGLIGAGHPVGATGVRMILDAQRQVLGIAGDTQVDGARNVQTLNIGGSATTTVSFVVGQ